MSPSCSCSLLFHQNIANNRDQSFLNEIQFFSFLLSGNKTKVKLEKMGLTVTYFKVVKRRRSLLTGSPPRSGRLRSRLSETGLKDVCWSIFKTDDVYQRLS